jgi:hypothetical protein
VIAENANPARLAASEPAKIVKSVTSRVACFARIEPTLWADIVHRRYSTTNENLNAQSALFLAANIDMLLRHLGIVALSVGNLWI